MDYDETDSILWLTQTDNKKERKITHYSRDYLNKDYSKKDSYYEETNSYEIDSYIFTQNYGKTWTAATLDTELYKVR